MNKEDILKKLRLIEGKVSKKSKNCNIKGTPFEAKLAYLGKFKFMLALKNTETGFSFIEITEDDWTIDEEKKEDIKGAITYYMYKLGYDGPTITDMDAIIEDYKDRLPERYRRLM